MQVIKYVQNGWPASLLKNQTEVQPYFSRKLELSTCRGLLYWGRRLVIPTRARPDILKLLHESHQGVSAMKRNARSLFWWPGLDREVEQLSGNCNECVQAAPMPAACSPVNWPETKERWSRVHIDFAGPVEGRMLLIVVDSHSKWIEACIMRSTTAEATVNQLRELFSRFGLPRTIVSDNGPQFISQHFEDFVKRNNVCHLRCAPYHPQSNGLAERAVRTIKFGLAKLTGGDLGKRLAQLLINYRRTPLACGKSPGEILLGYRIRSRLDMSVPFRPALLSDDVQVQGDSWDLGAPVWVRNFGQGERWSPGTVQNKLGSRMLVIETPEGTVRRHMDQVRGRQGPTESLGGPKDDSDNVGPPVTLGQPDSQGPPSEQDVPAPDGQDQPALRRSTRTRKPIDRLQY